MAVRTHDGGVPSSQRRLDRQSFTRCFVIAIRAVAVTR
jgi:hypothetical protein